MKRLMKLVPALAGVLLLFGCGPIRLVDMTPERPPIQITKKYPLQVALYIPPSSRGMTQMAVTNEGCWSYPDFTPYPFGKYFLQGSYGAFSQMFDKVDVVQNIPTDKEYDYIIDLNFTRISINWRCPDQQNTFYQTEGTVKLLDNKYAEIWGTTGSAQAKAPVAMSISAWGQLASQSITSSISELLKRFGNEMNSHLRTVMAEKRKAQLAAASAPQVGTAPQPATKSDVDVLPAAHAKGAKNAYAIVIGIEQYRQKLPRADFATHDAQTVTEYLTQVMGYPEENIVLLLNDHAARSDFEKYFEKWLGNNVEQGGTVFVYYSGHGAPNPKTSDAYLVPYDGDPSFIDETGYSLKQMYAALAKLPAKEVIVALDSCFSGAGGRSVISKGARPLVMNLQNNIALPKNMTVLSASSGDQISSTYDEKGHGLFTYFMLKGIKNEEVVRRDGSLNVDDLYGYLKPQVERVARKQYNNEQTPQLMGANKN